MSQSTSPRALEGIRILVVEDEAIIASELRFSLQDEGAIVTTAGSVRRALTVLDGGFAPDCALLDVNLTKGQTCAPIADRLRADGVGFVLHSGDYQEQGELITRLAAPILAKPADMKTIVKYLVRCVS